MITFIDSDMRLHLAVAQVWGLLTIRLADDPVLQLCPTCYAKALKKYIRLFEQQMHQRSIQAAPASTRKKLHRLRAAQRQLETNAIAFEYDKRRLRSVYGEDCQMTGRRRHASCLALRTSINDRLSNLERHFIDPNGVPDRKWYKHALVGPGKWDWAEADHQPFPALAAALETGTRQQFQQCEKDIANIIHEAAWFLREI
ncbi:Vacuolar protein sorting-associated protein 70 [Coemansia brasiliensis]|uniref:Vacuolar protein sorting-associated protein 70 n=1 Tax=Coemansia brasiliensis TaxID=2650707 RepID=A0A9W8I0Y1_9FUNG|nr:Vacuolar protein sorting-associated protein 70 [Coemansia brasiliensis]